jgi:hypothetical protein
VEERGMGKKECYLPVKRKKIRYIVMKLRSVSNKKKLKSKEGVQ